MLIRIAVSAHSLWGHDKIGVLLRLVYMMRVALAVELAVCLSLEVTGGADTA
jgi:hypothetical protein